MMKIHVMGSGCRKCDEVKQAIAAAVAECGVEAEIIAVQDFREMAQFGVFSTPAVAVDGDVKVVGRVPEKHEILSWLQ